MRKLFCIGLMGVLSSSMLDAQTRNRSIYEGNAAYEKGQFKEAEAKYRQAFNTQKSNEAAYNLGNALYEQKSFQDAAAVYEHSAKNSGQSLLRAKAWYNKGNTALSEKKYQEAIADYKQALRENPLLNDARYNLAYAQTMLKKQAPPPPPKKQEEKKDSDKKDSDKKDSDKQQDQAQQAPSSKLSKEQADELLNALQREEKKVREKKEKQKGHPVSPEKDL
jgi:tetratricopeptide (TPR) repeat protein